MMHRHVRAHRAAVVLIAACAGLPAGAGAQQLAELSQINDRDWEARCLTTSRIFHRLAELRTGGNDPKNAVFTVRQWAAQQGDIGSHMKIDYSKSVDAAGGFVFQHTELNAPALAHFGYRSCEMQYFFQADTLKVDAGRMLLLDATRECQKLHPGAKQNPELRDCIQTESQRIVARVRTAKITVQK
jgi:hypothetical protein